MEAHAEFDFIGRADDELSFGSGALLLVSNLLSYLNVSRHVYINIYYISFIFPDHKFEPSLIAKRAYYLFYIISQPMSCIIIKHSFSLIFYFH